MSLYFCVTVFVFFQRAYIIFPRSNHYLVTEGTGYIGIKNESEQDLVMEGQKRRGVERGKVVATLRPGEQQYYAYKGHWCIKVLAGNPDRVHILGCATSGGDKKGNGLGMM